MFVTGSYQSLSYRCGPFSNRQGFPILGFGLCDQAIELILSFEDGAKRQARFRCDCSRAEYKYGDDDLPTSHNGTTQSEMVKLTRLKPHKVKSYGGHTTPVPDWI